MSKGFVDCPKFKRFVSVLVYCDGGCPYRFSYNDNINKIACTYGCSSGYELKEIKESIM